MPVNRVLPLALVLLAGCASTMESSGALVLAPGGRAEGRVEIPPDNRAVLRLENLGPGRADFVVRKDGRGVLAEGPLGKSKTTTRSSEAEVLLVVVEAYEDARTTVSWSVESEHGTAVRWVLPRGGGLTE